MKGIELLTVGRISTAVRTIVKALSVAAFVLLSGSPVLSQTRASIRLLERLEEQFAGLDSLIFAEDYREVASPDTLIPAFGVMKENIIDSALLRRIDAEIREWKSKTGLSLGGSALWRTDRTIGLDDDATSTAYNGRLQAELRWNIFQSSLFNREGHIEEIRLKGKIDHASNRKDHLVELVYEQKEYFRLRHDSLLAGVLLHRVSNLRLLSDAYDYLLRNGNLSSDDLLRILNEKAEAERLLSTLSGDFPPTKDLSRPEVLFIEIDTAGLIRYVRETQTDLRLLRLRLQLLEQQERNTSYWEHTNLSPFVRYSYYTRPGVPNVSNFDVGVSITVPLTTEWGNRKKTIRAERDFLTAEQYQVSQRMTARIRFLSEEINRVNRSLIGEYTRIGELKKYLSDRLLAYRHGQGEYNRLARVKEYNIYLQCLEKLIQFQYKRDCYITDLQGLFADISVLWFCRTRPLSDSLTNEN